jgi:hypothetical protein
MDWATITANAAGAGWLYHWYYATTATPPDWGTRISGFASFNVPHLQDGYYRVAATSGQSVRAAVPSYYEVVAFDLGWYPYRVIPWTWPYVFGQCVP